jgi:hypothetical protein
LELEEMKRAYYTVVFATFYGTAGLALCLCALSGCGSGQRLPGDRGPSLIARGPVAPRPPAVTVIPDGD